MLNILTFNFHLLRKYIQMKMPIYKHDTYFWHGSYNSLPVPFRPLTGPYPESLAQHFVIFWSNPKTRFFWSFFFSTTKARPEVRKGIHGNGRGLRTELQLLGLKKTMSGLRSSIEADHIEWWFFIGRSSQKWWCWRWLIEQRKDVTENSEVGKCNNRWKVQIIESPIALSECFSGLFLEDIFSWSCFFQFRVGFCSCGEYIYIYILRCTCILGWCLRTVVASAWHENDDI